ncbi:hypothetical protein ACIA49_18645 [Kribbella sp. NPDC051587]|uniref:hypothetical protein n=1 Tax=Kribbella sp. NPDC051587 TaxID=3364119 RepID=UPI0037A708C8
MERDVERLRAAADSLNRDLRRTLGGDWGCSVDGYVLTVVGGRRMEQVLLDSRVDEENWPAAAWSAEFRDHTVEDDAAEAVATEVLEVLRLWHVEWPLCPDHGRPTDLCSRTWVCPGPPSHDVAPMGDLASG